MLRTSVAGGMFDMDNPFRFGGPVTGKEFVDRDKEAAEMFRDLKNGVNVLLFSHRRMGKSSLIAEVMRRNRDEMIFVYVDLYGVTTKTKMVEVFMTALVGSAYGSLQKVAVAMKDLIRGSKFRLVVNEKAEPGIEISLGEPTTPEIQDVLDLPETIAKKKGKRVVVVFDEFQEIGLLDGSALLKAMRSRIQMHKHVSYVFAGSKKHLLLSIFEEREGAFFKMAKGMELGPMPDEDAERFLVERFASKGGRLPSEAAKAIVSTAKGNPYYIQLLGYELYGTSTSPKWPEDFEAAISAALEHQGPAYSVLWDSIKSGAQRRYLVAAAIDDGPTRSARFIERHALRSASNVQKAIAQLDSRGITENGRVIDPLLVLWLRRLAGGKTAVR